MGRGICSPRSDRNATLSTEPLACPSFPGSWGAGGTDPSPECLHDTPRWPRGCCCPLCLLLGPTAPPCAVRAGCPACPPRHPCTGTHSGRLEAWHTATLPGQGPAHPDAGLSACPLLPSAGAFESSKVLPPSQGSVAGRWAGHGLRPVWDGPGTHVPCSGCARSRE